MLTCPDGIGRDRVRSTLPSRSRSVMSFQVQPAPRMTKAPTKNSATSHGSVRRSPAMPQASAADHQQGIRRSQDPIGRSKRESRRYGRVQSGAPRIDPIAGGIGDAAGALRHRASALPERVSKVEPPARVVVVVSGSVGEPSTSLKVGPGAERGCAAALHTRVRSCTCSTCEVFRLVRMSGGMPQSGCWFRRI